MAIRTQLSLSSDGNGAVVLVEGTLDGSQGRSVTIQATPAPGYRFDRWEVQTFPVELQTFAVVASNPVATVTEVCSDINITRQYDGFTQYNSTYQNVARELFTDGTMLYIDTAGNTPAPTGYWGAGGGTYYYWDGGRLPQLQTCTSQTTTTTTTTGTGSPQSPRTVDSGAPRMGDNMDTINRDVEPQ
jgi:hypothetical protein